LNLAEKGGGVAVGTLTFSALGLEGNTEIWNNTAIKGGGLYLGSGRFMDVAGYSITVNTADFGGGLDLRSGTSWNGDPFGYIWKNYPDNVYEEPEP
jgi:hypothetical protein